MPEAVPFKEQNTEWKGYGKSVGDLPAYSDQQQTISCWRLTKPELEEVMRTGVVWLHSLNRGAPLQPVTVSAFNPFQQR